MNSPEHASPPETCRPQQFATVVRIKRVDDTGFLAGDKDIFAVKVGKNRCHTKVEITPGGIRTIRVVTPL